MADYLEYIVIADIRKVYGSLFLEQETVLVNMLAQIYVETGREFIFLVNK